MSDRSHSSSSQSLRDWKPYRSPHRSRNDHASHDGAESQASPDVLDHAMVPAGDPDQILDQASLDALIGDLRQAGSFAYDSEFIGEQTYYPHICLIQVATTDRIALIDTMAELDLAGFWELLADPAVEKIVHAGLQDLEPVMRYLNTPARHVFDTQIAAGFMGLDYPMSLTRLVEQQLGADMGQGAKFTQWDRRPLTPVQMAYAANDVRYLPLLHQKISDQLNALGNMTFARQACLELSDPTLYRSDPLHRKVRAKGVRSLKPPQRAVLGALQLWREAIAQQENLPPRALLPDPSMLDLAVGELTLKQVKGIPSPVLAQYSQAIEQIIEQARKGPTPASSPRHRPLTESQKAGVQQLWEAVQAHCLACQVAVGVVTSKAQVTRHYMDRQHDNPQPPDTKLTTSWRAELLGPVLEPSV